ncbi:MAG: M50 family metallopeptidase [Planctomycetota bacterium]|nr:M50 family metallopeptidase [Planctomycetota bacterium]
MIASPRKSEGISLHNVVLQFGLMSVIFYLWSSPIMQPAKIMVVLFHEMSHGLMAIVTGGKVVSIEIRADEGGACETEGGMPLFIVSAGYLGSMFFGGLILYLSRFRDFVPLVYGMLTLVIISAVVTVLSGSYSKTFCVVLAALFILGGFLTPVALGGLMLRVIGTVSCLYSIFDIYWDILANHGAQAIQNDAVVFAALSGVSAQSVGMIWLVAAVCFFLVVLRQTLRAGPPEVRQQGAMA